MTDSKKNEFTFLVFVLLVVIASVAAAGSLIWQTTHAPKSRGMLPPTSALKNAEATRQAGRTNKEAAPTAAVQPAKPADKKDEPPTSPLDQRIAFNVTAGNTAFAGNPEAPVTLITYLDYQCPYCKRVSDTILDLLKSYPNEVKWVVKQHPLSFHNQAALASEAVMAAKAQGKFIEMHQLLMKNQGKLSREALEGYAKELALNLDQFKADLDKEAYKAQIDQETKEALAVGATGTPANFINGRYVRGAAAATLFKSIIDQELAWAKANNRPTFKIGQNVSEVAPRKSAQKNDNRPDPSKVYSIPVEGRPTLGKADAPITIVDYFDFQCPYCSNVHATLNQIAKEYPDKVKIVFKMHPLSFHPKAQPAAEAAMAAHEQGKYIEMSDLIFKNKGKMDRADFENYAKEIGLNLDQFKASLDNGSQKKIIEQESNEAIQMKASGTPAIFINGKYFGGARPYESFKQKIDEELKALGK